MFLQPNNASFSSQEFRSSPTVKLHVEHHASGRRRISLQLCGGGGLLQTGPLRNPHVKVKVVRSPNPSTPQTPSSTTRRQSLHPEFKPPLCYSDGYKNQRWRRKSMLPLQQTGFDNTCKGVDRKRNNSQRATLLNQFLTPEDSRYKKSEGLMRVPMTSPMKKPPRILISPHPESSPDPMNTDSPDNCYLKSPGQHYPSKQQQQQQQHCISPLVSAEVRCFMTSPGKTCVSPKISPGQQQHQANRSPCFIVDASNSGTVNHDASPELLGAPTKSSQHVPQCPSPLVNPKRSPRIMLTPSPILKQSLYKHAFDSASPPCYNMKEISPQMKTATSSIVGQGTVLSANHGPLTCNVAVDSEDKKSTCIAEDDHQTGASIRSSPCTEQSSGKRSPINKQLSFLLNNGSSGSSVLSNDSSMEVKTRRPSSASISVHRRTSNAVQVDSSRRQSTTITSQNRRGSTAFIQRRPSNPFLCSSMSAPGKRRWSTAYLLGSKCNSAGNESCASVGQVIAASDTHFPFHSTPNDPAVPNANLVTPEDSRPPDSPIDNTVFRSSVRPKQTGEPVLGLTSFTSACQSSILKSPTYSAHKKHSVHFESVFSTPREATKYDVTATPREATKYDVTDRSHLLRKKSVTFGNHPSTSPTKCMSLARHRKPRSSLASCSTPLLRRNSNQCRRLSYKPCNSQSNPIFSIHAGVGGCVPEIQLGRVLGAGGFGAVYQGLYRNQLVAVKRMHAITKNQRARIQSYKAELNALRLQHPNIVRVLTSGCTDSLHGDAYIVMEYAGDRNLTTVLSDPIETMDILRRVSMGADIASALRFIHANCIIHLDVKPANVIITPQGNCKLADFGCCQVIEEDTGQVSPTQRSELTGTYAYRSPEVLRGIAPCTKADIYALGVTLWQMQTRVQPYNGQNQHVIIYSVVKHNLRPSLSSVTACPREMSYTELFVQCWAPAPSDRPTAARVEAKLRGWMDRKPRRGSRVRK